MSAAGQQGVVELRADLNGSEQSGVWTLSGTTATITIPDGARIITLLPSAAIRVRLGAAPAAAGANAFAAGAPVEAATRRAFLLPDGTSRELRVLGTSGTTIAVEVRP